MLQQHSQSSDEQVLQLSSHSNGLGDQMLQLHRYSIEQDDQVLQQHSHSNKQDDQVVHDNEQDVEMLQEGKQHSSQCADTQVYFLKMLKKEEKSK